MKTSEFAEKTFGIKLTEFQKKHLDGEIGAKDYEYTANTNQLIYSIIKYLHAQAEGKENETKP